MAWHGPHERNAWSLIEEAGRHAPEKRINSHGMGWDGMGWDGMGWEVNQLNLTNPFLLSFFPSKKAK